jgi:glycosyltransferase involved in cell wall biosynthesis
MALTGKIKGKPFDVVFYLYYDELETLGPYLYGIQMWRARGHDVSVYSLSDGEAYQRLTQRVRSQFAHRTIKFPFWVQICALGLQGLGFAARKLLRLKTRGSEWAKLLKMGYFACCCLRMTKKGRQCVLIAADPPGLWAAALASRKYGYPYVYFVKEMFLSGDARNVFDRVVKMLERKANRKALYTVEFDETRAQMLRIDNGLAPGSMLWVPNAPIGPPNTERGRYFRDGFGISENKKIALYTGGISDYNLTYEHVGSVETWPENVVLVMHLKGKPRDLNALRERAGKIQRDIYFSTDLLPFDEIDKIYSSCDIGLALYGDHTLNHKYAGLSSGKLFNFMKACVPVITNDTPSCLKAVQKTGCGVCIGSIWELGPAIQRILDNEKEFRKNCNNTFPRFSHDVNHARFMDVIESSVAL